MEEPRWVHVGQRLAARTSRGPSNTKAHLCLQFLHKLKSIPRTEAAPRPSSHGGGDPGSGRGGRWPQGHPKGCLRADQWVGTRTVAGKHQIPASSSAHEVTASPEAAPGPTVGPCVTGAQSSAGGPNMVCFEELLHQTVSRVFSFDPDLIW